MDLPLAGYEIRETNGIRSQPSFKSGFKAAPRSPWMPALPVDGQCYSTAVGLDVTFVALYMRRAWGGPDPTLTENKLVFQLGGPID